MANPSLLGLFEHRLASSHWIFVTRRSILAWCSSVNVSAHGTSVIARHRTVGRRNAYNGFQLDPAPQSDRSVFRNQRPALSFIVSVSQV